MGILTNPRVLMTWVKLLRFILSRLQSTYTESTTTVKLQITNAFCIERSDAFMLHKNNEGESCRSSRKLNPFQIYPSALKSIIRHLGVSHLPRAHCLVALVGCFISEHHFHMLMESASWRGAQTVHFAPQLWPDTTKRDIIKTKMRANVMWSSSLSGLHKNMAAQREGAALPVSA